LPDDFSCPQGRDAANFLVLRHAGKGHCVGRQRRPTACGDARLRHQFRDHAGVLDAGELEVEAEVAVGEPLVVEAEQVQHGGVEVADVHRVFDDVVGEIVGLAVDLAGPRLRRQTSSGSRLAGRAPQ